MSAQLPIFGTSKAKPKMPASGEKSVGREFDAKKLIDNVDVLAEASQGVKKLRSLVLKLGLAGRLGTNDPRELPPLVSLAGEPDPSVAAPHPNWIVCDLPDVADIEMGNSPPGTSYNERGDGVPLINGPVEFSPGPFGLTRRTKFTTAPARMCRRGDLLVCVRGATTGRTNIADFDACIGRGVALVRAHKDQGYLNYFMWSVGNDLLAAGTGTTFPAISRDDLVALRVLLPPVAEQRRIVAKVDELMRLLDDLEAKQVKKRETQTQLRTAALEALTSADGLEGFDAAWKRVAQNINVLLHAAMDVKEFRRTIRGLAYSGRLIGSDASWPSVTVEQVAQAVVDCPHSTPKWTDSGVTCLRTNNFRVEGLDLGELRYVSPDTYRERTARLVPEPGDVVYSREGGILGIACVLPDTPRICLGQRMMLIRPSARCDANFLALALNAPQTVAKVKELTGGTASPHLNVGDVRKFLFPLPPLAEQALIVAKVEHLMKLCDDLEGKLRRSEETASKLVEAVVSEMVA